MGSSPTPGSLRSPRSGGSQRTGVGCERSERRRTGRIRSDRGRSRTRGRGMGFAPPRFAAAGCEPGGPPNSERCRMAGQSGRRAVRRREPGFSGNDRQGHHLCTLIGCAPPGVYVLSKDVDDVYPSAKRLRACADRYCATSKLGRSNFQSVRVRVPFTEPEPVAVSVSVLGANARPLARVGFRGELERSHPNGRECDEGCLSLTVLYEATKERITANPGRLRATGTRSRWIRRARSRCDLLARPSSA